MSQVLALKDERLHNMIRFIRYINSPNNIRLVRTLMERPLTYTELLNKMNYKRKSGHFAYYLRKARMAGVVEVDGRTKLYALTFRGIKIAELVESIERVANLDMNDINAAYVRMKVSLDTNRDWLEPLLKEKIEKIARGLG